MNAGAPSRTAVVTGSSSGIGRAIALALADSGWNIVVHTRRNVEGAQEVVEELDARGVQSTILTCDFRQADDLLTFVEKSWNWQGSIEGWINNAGVDVLTNESRDWPLEKKLDTLWQVDVRAALVMSRWVGQKMADAKREASIVNVGWDQAAQGMAGDSGLVFGTIKGAVHAMTLSLAQSLAPTVRVNAVAPGWIQTEWGKSADPSWSHRAESESLVGRWGTASDVAEVVAFLLGPGARFISGQVLPVNGGFRFGRPDLTDA